MDMDQREYPNWSDLVAVSCGGNHIIGLRADGMVLMVGSNKYGQCSYKGYKLFNSIETLEQEREQAKAKIEAERREKIASLEAEQAALNEELANLKGLFSGKRRKEIEARLAEIASELKTLGVE